MPASGGGIPRIYGTQIGLKEPRKVDEIKSKMRAGTFAFHEPDNQIAGIRLHGTRYYVKEGHHRMAAAFELYRETGDSTDVLELIRWGRWADRDHPPNDARPMPARHWWGRLRNWLGW
jgi:hypothetical protein